MVKVFRKIMLVTAFLITVFIFLAGFYSGVLLDDYRIDDSEILLSDAELDVESFIIENNFFDTFGVSSCETSNKRMQALGDELGELGRTLARYDAKGISKGKVFNQLKRKYFLSEIKTYILRKKIQDSCPDNSNVFLFFYNVENNQESLNQGYVLDNIVDREKNVIVFSFDKDFNDPALSVLMDHYNITVAPTLILNFEERFEGYVPGSVLGQHLKK